MKTCPACRKAISAGTKFVMLSRAYHRTMFGEKHVFPADVPLRINWDAYREVMHAHINDLGPDGEWSVWVCYVRRSGLTEIRSVDGGRKRGKTAKVVFTDIDAETSTVRRVMREVRRRIRNAADERATVEARRFADSTDAYHAGRQDALDASLRALRGLR